LRLVVDTSVVAAAFGRRGSASRGVLRACLTRRATLLLSNALAYEYEAVLGRPGHLVRSGRGAKRVTLLLSALFGVAEWHSVHFLIRPNLHDEADNHVVDLALAGGARAIVTYNVRDFARGEFRKSGLAVVTPAQALRMIANDVDDLETS
jgi:predicted nucleic acid-binding protein